MFATKHCDTMSQVCPTRPQYSPSSMSPGSPYSRCIDQVPHVSLMSPASCPTNMLYVATESERAELLLCVANVSCWSRWCPTRHACPDCVLHVSLVSHICPLCPDCVLRVSSVPCMCPACVLRVFHVSSMSRLCPACVPRAQIVS